MRRQRLRIDLPFLILILTEVILTSCHAEAANIAEDQRWEKKSRAETTDSESSAADYDVEKNSNGYGKVSNKGNKARFNLRKSDRNAAGKLRMKDQDSTEPNSVNYDLPTTNFKRGSWQCNGVEVPGDQINVAYSDKKSTQWSQNPAQSGSQPPMNFGFPQNLFFPKMSRGLTEAGERMNPVPKLVPVIKPPEWIQDPASNIAEGNFDYQRSDAEEIPDHLKPFREFLFSKDPRVAKEEKAHFVLDYLAKVAKTASDVSKIFQQIVRRNMEFDKPIQDIPRPVASLLNSANSNADRTERLRLNPGSVSIPELISYLLNPFAQKTNDGQREIEKSIKDPAKSQESFSDLTNSLNSDTKKEEHNRQAMNIMTGPFQLIADMLSAFGLTKNRRGAFQSTVNDQPNKPFWPMNNIQNPFELNTGYQGVSPFPNNDSPLSIQAMANLFNSFMQDGDHPKPSRRIDLDKYPLDRPPSVLESMLLNMPYYRMLEDEFKNLRRFMDIWPMNNVQNPSESNTDSQGVPSFPNNDSPLSIQAMANLFNSFMQDGDHPKPSRRIDLDKYPLDRPPSVLESMLLNMPYYRMLEDEFKNLRRFMDIWPMNNVQNPSEPNTDSQGVPPFPNNDSPFSIQGMTNLFNSFMQDGDHSKLSPRIDIDKHPPEKPLSTLESIIVSFPYNRLLKNQLRNSLGLMDIWPMNNVQNPSESNTDSQGVPSFPNNDSPFSIQGMTNLFNSFMQNGDHSKLSPRIDIDKYPEEKPLSILESIIVSVPYGRLLEKEFENSRRVTDIWKDVISKIESSPKSRSRRSIPEASDCPTIPNDYHRPTDSQNAYKLFTNHMSWNDARLNCKIEGAELALPRNQVQYDSMVEYAKRTLNNSDENFHVGFHGLFSAGNWTTVCGEPLPFEHWANRTAATHDVAEKKCGAMVIAKTNNDGFVVESCSQPQPFMCEIITPSHCA